MTQQEFDRLSDKFLKGDCTSEEMALLRKWSDLHYNEQSESDLFDSDKEEALTQKKIWKSLRITSFEATRKSWLTISVGLAASLILGGLLLFFEGQQSENPLVPSQTLSNQEVISSVSPKVTLPDGSTVILEKGADIVTDPSFGQKERKVFLKGEAFFDVKPDRQHPFVVVSGDLVTEVLGTSFRIKPEADLKKIEVSVHTGKVSVYTSQSQGQRKKDGVIASPNQKVSYDVISGSLKQDLVDLPAPVQGIRSPEELFFDETPLSELLKKISQVYGIEVIMGNPSISHCTFTGDLNRLNLYQQIDSICQVVGLEYEVRGTTIFIKGAGCSSSDR
jgi:transmembrane sensor